MTGPLEAHGPSYISSRSADVILSDIRPVKLNIEALRSINVLLDEFLYSILGAAHSLATSQLRAGLNKVLPTALGKEALLEAEMELRAYVERTGPSNVSLAAEERNEFDLQWAFELVRLKCQAYSTLSDSDEDPEAEARLAERMVQASAGGSPPKPTLVAPAALYLTAILESVCEHVLSNVGKVATRDSSRTTATIQDLFVALCEDDSVYGLFKTMKVYEKIECLTKSPKPRRSKSFSRSNDSPRTSSPQTPPPSISTQHTRVRMSSESVASTTTGKSPTVVNSRSSFDKARAMKMFVNNRSSVDQTLNGSLYETSHKRSDSALSDGTKQTIVNDGDDASSIDDQEFDDMMRSGSTMRVSLTPDRLKSMEVYNKEKGQRKRVLRQSDSRTSLKSEEKNRFVIPPTPEFPVWPLTITASIPEAEEAFPIGTKPQANRPRQTSVTSTPPVSLSATRLRSFSASMPPPDSFSHATRTSSKNSAAMPPPPPPTSISSRSARGRTMSYKESPYPVSKRPPTRHVTRNRESLDLDDVMDVGPEETAQPSTPARQTSTERMSKYPVSAGARDLIDFLAQGPPDIPEPPMLETPKKSGRLQRMISKLTLKEKEKDGGDGKFLRSNNDSSDSFSRSSRTLSLPQSPLTSPLYNKPIPPRPPPIPPISPPSSPSQTSLVEVLPNPYSPLPSPHSPRPRRSSSVRKGVSVMEAPILQTAAALAAREVSSSPTLPATTPPSPVPINGHVNGHVTPSSENEQDSPSKRSAVPIIVLPINLSARHSVKTIVDANQPSDSEPSLTLAILGHARDMHRLMSHATSADECRLLLDMFLVRSGLHEDAVDSHSQYHYPSPPSDTHQPLPPPALEHSLVELFLGGAAGDEPDLDEGPVSPKTIYSQFSAVTFPVSPPDTPLHAVSADSVDTPTSIPVGA